MVDIKPMLEAHVNAFFAKWKRQMKMAMLIGSSMTHLSNKGCNLSEDDVAQILYDIIREKEFVTFGDIKEWRHSEVVPQSYLT